MMNGRKFNPSRCLRYASAWLLAATKRGLTTEARRPRRGTGEEFDMDGQDLQDHSKSLNSVFILFILYIHV
jgi:hypothetical protein